MEFQPLSPGKLRVRLSREEMNLFGLSPEEFQEDSPILSLAVAEILEEARSRGIFWEATRIGLEVQPCRFGGCILLLTRAEEPQTVWGPALFRFEDGETLVSAACRLFRQYGHRIYKSSLYRFRGDYLLIIYPLDWLDHRTIHLLEEYAALAGEGEVAAAFVEEHGEALLRDGAIDTLSRYMDHADPS